MTRKFGLVSGICILDSESQLTDDTLEPDAIWKNEHSRVRMWDEKSDYAM